MDISGRIFDDEGRHLDRFGLLLLLTIASVTVLSLVDLDDPTSSVASGVGWLLVTMIVGATLVLAARASGLARRPRIIIEVAIAVSIAGASLVAIAGALGGDAFSAFSGFRLSIVWVVMEFAAPLLVLRRIMVHDRVSRATLFGAVSTFLLIALSFNYAFLAVESWTSSPFFGVVESTSTFMYFSLVTITTLGYGDVAPVGDFGRYLSTVEAVIGQVFLVMIVARLVALYGTDRSFARLDGPDGT